jgi:hypothetical protein
MRDVLLAAAVILGMVAIVPLMVWGGTGSWRHALHALKEYALTMGLLAAPAVALGAAVALWEYVIR